MKLIEKLKTNFQLSNMIVRILFVVSFVFCNWQDLLISSQLVLETVNISQNATIPLLILGGIISAVFVLLVVPYLINMALNFLRLYNVPRSEYVLIALAFMAIGNIGCGILNLVNLFTPILIAWGAVLFPVIVSCVCMIAFYKVTAKLYFNDVTRANYFRNLAIVYLVFVVVTGVMS